MDEEDRRTTMEIFIGLFTPDKSDSPASKLSPYNLNSLLDAASTVVEMTASGSSPENLAHL